MQNTRFAAIAFATLVIALAACSGNTGSVGPSRIVPPTDSSPASGSGTNAKVKVLIKLKIPPRPVSKIRRTRKYVSPATASVTVLVNGANPTSFSTLPTSPNCTPAPSAGGSVCTATVSAPATTGSGTDMFTMNTYDSDGNLLSSGTAAQAITSGAANTVNLTLSGVVSTLSISQPAPVPAGAPTSEPFTVEALDNDGDTIVGPGGYIDSNGNPLTLYVCDFDSSGSSSSGTTSLSTPAPTLSASPINAAIAYSGNPPYGGVPELAVSLNSTCNYTSTPPYNAYTNFVIYPVLTVVPNTNLVNNPLSMTLGGDGNLYVLENDTGVAEGTGAYPVVEQVPPGGGYTDYTYGPCGEEYEGPTAASLSNGIATGPDGGVYFTDFDECEATNNTGNLVELTTAGTPTFATTNTIAFGDTTAYFQSGLQFLFAPDGNAVFNALVGGIGSEETENRARHHATSTRSKPAAKKARVNIVSQNAAPRPSDVRKKPQAATPAQATSPTPIPATPAFVTSATNGAANYVTYASALGAGPSYTEDAGPSAITLDTSGNAWFPLTASGEGNSYELVRANGSTATAYTLPQPSGEQEEIYGVTAAADGNVWYVTEQTGNCTQPAVGMITPSGTFSNPDYVLTNGSCGDEYNAAIVDDGNGLLYTLTTSYIASITYGCCPGQVTLTPLAPEFNPGTAGSGVRIGVGTNGYGSEIYNIYYLLPANDAIYQLIY